MITAPRYRELCESGRRVNRLAAFFLRTSRDKLFLQTGGNPSLGPAGIASDASVRICEEFL